MRRLSCTGATTTAWALAPLLTILAPVAARAEPLSSPACPADDLLAHRSPIDMEGVRANPGLVTDQRLAPEGAQWDSTAAMVFDLPSGVVTYDLGQPTPLTSFFVQADANDVYKIFGSLERTPSSFTLIAEVPMVSGDGLRGRAIRLDAQRPVTVRYLRIGEGVGDNFYSISEFAAYCQTPEPFPPKMGVTDAPPARVPERPWFQWNNESSARFEMVLAFAGMALIGWGLWLRRHGMAAHLRKWRDILLITVGVLGAGAYWNFGSFHFGNYIHIWEMFHYYVGSKYFAELSYDRLYDCASVADAEDPALRRRVELRKIMDLRTNMMGPTTGILAHPERCKQHFTPARWQEFKHDVAFFRVRHGDRRWEDVFSDHGYNATPVWTILGSTLANLAPASDRGIFLLSLVDWGAALGMLAMIGWGFGWRTLCVAAAVFGTNFPSRFYWTGGSFLRWDWLFYLVGGICLLRRERWALGGFFLSYSSLLRIFPVFALLGPAMVLLREYVATRNWKAWRSDRRMLSRGVLALDRRYLSLVAGAALAVVVLVPISLVKVGGVAAYRDFVRNTAKHAETPLTNYMGLRTAVAYKPSEAGRFLRDNRADDAWGAWKRAKIRTFHQRLPLFFLLAAGFVVLLWFAVRGADPWVACALGATLIAAGAELTSYYYSFLVAVALLYRQRRQVGVVMLAVTGLTSFIDWAPTQFLPQTRPYTLFSMPTWLDEQYMWMGVVTLLGFAWILFDFCFPPGQSGPFVRRALAWLMGGPDVAATAPATAHTRDDAIPEHGRPGDEARAGETQSAVSPAAAQAPHPTPATPAKRTTRKKRR
jgi:hypothetical protein